jgi:hypothetical protein
MCCGQRRSLLNSRAAPSQPRARAPQAGANGQQLNFLRDADVPPPIAASPADVAMRYSSAGAVRVRGLITGRSYEFTGPQSVVSIDPRDVPGFLHTGLFRRV